MAKTNMEQLETLFNCIICLNTAVDPHICPHCSKVKEVVCHLTNCLLTLLPISLAHFLPYYYHSPCSCTTAPFHPLELESYECSKLGCRSCFHRALRANSACPHCRVHLPKEDLVYLRWGGDLSSHINRMRSLVGADSDDSCQQHRKPLSTYCQTCSRCVCVNCALFGIHQGHAMRDLDDVYREHVNKMGDHVSALRTAQARLLERMQGKLGLNEHFAILSFPTLFPFPLFIQHNP